MSLIARAVPGQRVPFVGPDRNITIPWFQFLNESIRQLFMAANGDDGATHDLAVALALRGNPMALNPKRLVDGAELSASAVAYYTATAKTIITHATFTNRGGSAAVVTAYLPPNGLGAGGDHEIRVSVAAGQTTTTDALNHVLETGGRIFLQANVPNAVAAMISGAQENE